MNIIYNVNGYNAATDTWVLRSTKSSETALRIAHEFMRDGLEQVEIGLMDLTNWKGGF